MCFENKKLDGFLMRLKPKCCQSKFRVNLWQIIDLFSHHASSWALLHIIRKAEDLILLIYLLMFNACWGEVWFLKTTQIPLLSFSFYMFKINKYSSHFTFLLPLWISLFHAPYIYTLNYICKLSKMKKEREKIGDKEKERTRRNVSTIES